MFWVFVFHTDIFKSILPITCHNVGLAFVENLKWCLRPTLVSELGIVKEVDLNNNESWLKVSPILFCQKSDIQFKIQFVSSSCFSATFSQWHYVNCDNCVWPCVCVTLETILSACVFCVVSVFWLTPAIPRHTRIRTLWLHLVSSVEDCSPLSSGWSWQTSRPSIVAVLPILPRSLHLSFWKKCSRREWREQLVGRVVDWVILSVLRRIDPHLRIFYLFVSRIQRSENCRLLRCSNDSTSDTFHSFHSSQPTSCILLTYTPPCSSTDSPRGKYFYSSNLSKNSRKAWSYRTEQSINNKFFLNIWQTRTELTIWS